MRSFKLAVMVLAGLLAGAGGCGVLENLVLDPARLAAQEVVQGAVQEAVGAALEQADPISLFGPLLE